MAASTVLNGIVKILARIDKGAAFIGTTTLAWCQLTHTREMVDNSRILRIKDEEVNPTVYRFELTCLSGTYL